LKKMKKEKNQGNKGKIEDGPSRGKTGGKNAGVMKKRGVNCRRKKKKKSEKTANQEKKKHQKMGMGCSRPREKTRETKGEGKGRKKKGRSTLEETRVPLKSGSVYFGGGGRMRRNKGGGKRGKFLGWEGGSPKGERLGRERGHLRQNKGERSLIGKGGGERRKKIGP